MGGESSTPMRRPKPDWPKWFGRAWWTIFGGIALCCVVVPVVLSHVGKNGPSELELFLLVGSVVGTWLLAHVWIIGAVLVSVGGRVGLRSDWLLFWLLAFPVALVDAAIAVSLWR